MNPLFNMFGQPQNLPFPMNMMQQFTQFRQTFQGDPRQEVQQLLNSGRMTQSQFDQLSSMAQQFQNFFNR